MMNRGEIIIKGAKIETAHWGPNCSDAPTLILLHEGLGSISTWGEFPVALAEATRCGVFAYSRLGYGQSDACVLPRPLDYMEIEARDILPRVLGAIGFERGALIGHSDGASIAALYPGFHEDHRVRALVLMAPHVVVEDISIRSIAETKIAFEAGDLKAKLARHHRDVEAAFRGWNDAWLDPGFRDWDISWAIAHIRIPTLLLQGCDDEYGTLRQLDIITEEAPCPVTKLLLESAGHSPHRDRRDAVLEAISAQLDSIRADLWRDWQSELPFRAKNPIAKRG